MAFQGNQKHVLWVGTIFGVVEKVKETVKEKGDNVYVFTKVIVNGAEITRFGDAEFIKRFEGKPCHLLCSAVESGGYVNLNLLAVSPLAPSALKESLESDDATEYEEGSAVAPF